MGKESTDAIHGLGATRLTGWSANTRGLLYDPRKAILCVDIDDNSVFFDSNEYVVGVPLEAWRMLRWNAQFPLSMERKCMYIVHGA